MPNRFGHFTLKDACSKHKGIHASFNCPDENLRKCIQFPDVTKFTKESRSPAVSQGVGAAPQFARGRGGAPPWYCTGSGGRSPPEWQGGLGGEDPLIWETKTKNTTHSQITQISRNNLDDSCVNLAQIHSTPFLD